MRFWIHLGCVAATLTFGAWAQTAPLTLSDCVQKALDARNELTIARNDLRIAQQGVIGARAGFLPQVQATGGYTYNSPSRTADSQQFIALNAVHEYVTQFGASLPIDTSGKLRAELARARSEREAARQSVRLTERDLRRAVTASYFRLVLARRLVDVAKSTLAEAQSFESRTRKLNAGGEAARADVVKAQGEVAFLQQTLQGAELDAETANHDLASYWTANVADALQVVDPFDGSLPQPEAAPASDAYTKRVEFSLLDAQRLGLKADIGAARADMLPQTSLNWQYGIDSTRYSWADRGQAFFATVNVPIFDWLKAWSATKQAHLRLESFDVTRDMARRNLSKEYQSALARMSLTWVQIETTRQQVSLSQENFRLAQVKYEGGEGLALDVVAAQSQLAQARGNYYSAIAAYFNARADFEVASGK
ncbi:MAG: TolC family protein [Bryobacteraceae bacterium]|nr:TolC family protein [Bryobacteraceae bacterium]